MFRLQLHGVNPGAEEVRSAIKDYGYNIRTLLEVLKGQRAAVERRIVSKVNDLGLAAIQRMLVAGVDRASEAARSHTLIMTLCSKQRKPTDEKYLTSDDVSRTLVGTFVSRALFKQHGAKFYQHVQFTASLFGRVLHAPLQLEGVRGKTCATRQSPTYPTLILSGWSLTKNN
jgi:hypothetical protein